MVYAYERAQDEKEQGEKQHSPPFSRLLLPASQPMKPLQDLRLARYRAPAVPHHTYGSLEANTKFEQGVDTMADDHWHLIYPAHTNSRLASNWHSLTFGPGRKTRKLASESAHTVRVPSLLRRFYHQEYHQRPVPRS